MPCIGTVLYFWLGLEIVTKPLPDYLDYGLNRYPYSASKYVKSICGSYVKKMPSSIKLLLDYSAHLYEARKHFEAFREQKPSFTDFLSRCSHANFSKRLDLWHFLECPKTRLIRYPLLLDRLIKLTPSTDPELSHLLVVRSALTCIVEELNRRIGEAMRNLYLKYIEFSVNLEYKDMVWRQKSLLLKGDLRTGIGEVTAFVFPQLMVITTSTRLDNTVRPISHLCNGRLSRRNTKLRVTTSPGRVSTSNRAPSPNVSSPTSEIYCHQWSLPSVFKTDSPIDLDNARPGKQLSKCSRLFRCLSSFMTLSSTKSEVPPFKGAASFTSTDATLTVEKYHVCFPPLILKEYILEDVTDDNIPLSVLKFPFSMEKTHQNLFRLFPCDDYLKRKSARRVKQSDLLHSYKKVMSKSSHEIKCFSSSSLNYSSLFLRKSPKTISRDFIFQASSSGDKKYWITTLIPLVHSYNQSKSCNNLVLI
ncbi:Rho guanine nucleotide exchange factor 3 isoform 3 [Schistosoma japonicum]|nr:Rho guanine nucleotide exchange factor 3 isoform 3 [Schistosoma japonicum]